MLLKRILLLGLCCSLVCLVKSQTINSTAYDCPTSSYQNAKLFQQYFLANQLELAESVMADWLDKCALREVTLRADLLLKMTNGRFNEEEDLPDNFLNYLIEFLQRDSITGFNRKMWYEYNRPYYCYIPIGEKFDQFTRQQFQALAERQTGLTALISGAYGGAPQALFEKLQTTYATSKLGKAYNAYVLKHTNQLEANFAIFAGAWIPLNSNQPLGIHPEIGFQLGGKKGKWKYDLSIAFRFLEARSSYFAKRGETSLLESTKHYFGGFIGFDVGYEVWQRKRNEVQFFTGVAYDGFDALREKGELSSQSVSSYNLNIGCTYRRYFKRGKYMGLMLKYNVVDYTLGNVVDFSVQPLTVSLVFGVQKNEIARRQLAVIRYNSD